MESHAPGYRYIHPDQMYDTYQGMESGRTQLLFACPHCQGKATFSLPQRVGHCFVCGIIIKLHSMYDGTAIDILFPALPVEVSPIAGDTGRTATRIDLELRPLSPAAWDYITSRGIARSTVERFGLLVETTYYGRPYLAWPTCAGDYELRALGQVETGREKITPRGHHKHVSLVQGVPHTTICIVCEGLFSALAYAQIHPQDDAWYVILNSISNGTKLVAALETLTTAGVYTFLLALDNDHAGRDMTKELVRALLEAGVQVLCHYPPTPGDDWNDVLRRGEAIHTSPTRVAPVGLVTIESPPVVPAAQPDHLDVHYYERILTAAPKVVVAAPCGAGKTLAAADLIAERWREGVLYVAERVEQLHTMQALLQQREVPPDVIGLYALGTADQRALRQEQVTKPIALLTHVRMQLDAPQAYVCFPRHGGTATRRLMIVDESITPLLILSVPRLFIQGFLSQLGLTWTDLGTLDPDTIDDKIAGIEALLTRHAHFPLRQVGIRYQEWTNDLPAVDRVVEVRRYAYYQMLYQILAGHYLRRAEDIDVLVPMAPHLTWYQCFPQILVLDATALLTDFLYPDYAILTPRTWNYHQITGGYKVYSSLGNLTKTTITSHKETFLQELKVHIVPILEAFQDPYIVTYKQLEADVQTVLQHPVQHYGATRGSNAYRTMASAVLLGAYRPPVSFDQLATLLFGPRYSPVKMAVAHWIQEAYRTRIRSDEPITLLVMGERSAVRLLEETMQIPFSTSAIGGADNPDIMESILGRMRYKLEKSLLTQLRQDGMVDSTAFARERNIRDTTKVLRAVRGILQRYPYLEGHLVIEGTTIRLIAKPVPRR
jgi:hypothetical protein